MATSAANLEQRASLLQDTRFRGRVQIAVLKVATAVIQEDSGTADHALRVRMAAFALKESDLVALRLSVVIASAVPATYDDATGLTTVDITDADLLTLIGAKWTMFASAFVTSA